MKHIIHFPGYHVKLCSGIGRILVALRSTFENVAYCAIIINNQEYIWRWQWLTRFNNFIFYWEPHGHDATVNDSYTCSGYARGACPLLFC